MMGTTVYPLRAYAFARLEAKRLFSSPDYLNTEIIRGVGTATTTLTHLEKGNGKHMWQYSTSCMDIDYFFIAFPLQDK